jgi:hypothetical protein
MIRVLALFTWMLLLPQTGFPTLAPGEDTLSRLIITGNILNAVSGKGLCKIEVLSNNRVVDSCFIKKGKTTFKVSLYTNSYYALRISKKGFVTKLISVDSKCPPDIIDDFEFRFNTELVSEQKARQLNADALDFPIAIIQFDKEEEMFIYDENYTKEIKKDISSSELSEKKF